MYLVYVDGILLPVAPPKIEMYGTGGAAVSCNAEGGELVLRGGGKGLRRFKFTAVLPAVKYPFARYKNNLFVPPDVFIKKFAALKNRAFPFVIVRFGNRKSESFNVVLDGYRILEDAAAYGADTAVEFCFVEYRKAAVRRESGRGNTALKPANAGGNGAVVYHNVVKGDCLYNIALKYLGDGNRFKEIYLRNQTLIDGRNRNYSMPIYTIYPGQRLEIITV